MARFTMTLKDIMDKYDIFDFDYDLPIGMSKAGLQGEFYARYVMREIAYETFDIWFIKFKSAWLRMVGKYHDVFLQDLNPLNTSVTKVKNKQTTETASDIVNKNIATPIDTIITTNDVPNDMSTGQSSASGESNYEGETSKQHGSSIDLLNKYGKLKVTIDLFLDEFNDLFFGRY